MPQIHFSNLCISLTSLSKLDRLWRNNMSLLLFLLPARRSADFFFTRSSCKIWVILAIWSDRADLKGASATGGVTLLTGLIFSSKESSVVWSASVMPSVFRCFLVSGDLMISSAKGSTCMGVFLLLEEAAPAFHITTRRSGCSTRDDEAGAGLALADLGFGTAFGLAVEEPELSWLSDLDPLDPVKFFRKLENPIEDISTSSSDPLSPFASVPPAASPVGRYGSRMYHIYNVSRILNLLSFVIIYIMLHNV